MQKLGIIILVAAAILMLASCASEDHAKSMDGDQGRWAKPEENRWLTDAYQNCFERVYGRYEALEAESI